MGKKRLLTLDDLREYFVQQNKNVTFNSKDSDHTIVVHVNEPINFKKSQRENEYITKMPLRYCHIDKNRNGSAISRDSMEDAMPTLYNTPILGYIYKDDNGDYQFAGHEFTENEDGEIEYQEFPVGVTPESAGLKLVEEDDTGKTYVEGNGIIWNNYSPAYDILERDGSEEVSVELAVDELSYDAKEKVLNIEKFTFLGVTILGVDPDTGDEIKEGMEGSNITLSDFSKENNSVVTQSLIEELKKLNAHFEAFNDNNSKEGGNQQVTKFEELLKQYNVTEEDVKAKFDYSEMSDEDLEKAFKEAFESNAGTGDGDGNGNAPSADAGEGQPTGFSAEGVEPQNNNDPIVHEIKFSVNNKDFSVSLNDQIYALSELVNATYSESDNAYYSVIVYDDNVVMVDYWTGAAYRQAYKVRKGEYSLQGDRVPVHAVYVTQDEESKLDEMKNNYSAISDKLNEYEAKEAEEEKLNIINSDDYSLIREQEDFKNLAENHAEFSAEDVKNKCDSILLSYYKANKPATFEQHVEEPKSTTMTQLPIQNKKPSRYGNLFNKH